MHFFLLFYYKQLYLIYKIIKKNPKMAKKHYKTKKIYF
jgi:hypothetical protein